MAKTQFIDIPPELAPLQAKALEQRDRYVLGVVQGHKREPSKKQKRELKRSAIIDHGQQGRGSLFRYLSPFWTTLSDPAKNSWRDAAINSNLTNWQLYISDNAARIRDDIETPTTPSTIWQVRAGRILVEPPAFAVILRQDHPQQYVVANPVRGKSWKDELVTVDEIFDLPLELSISYKSNLTQVSPRPSLFFGARVWTSYQGQDIFQNHTIRFDPVSDWTRGSLTISHQRGILIGYRLLLTVVGYNGELLFDNVSAFHTGTNWARDPRCDNINKEFKNAFALVPPFWIPSFIQPGVSFSSQYPPAL